MAWYYWELVALHAITIIHIEDCYQDSRVSTKSCTVSKDCALADWSSLHLSLLDLRDKRLSTSTDQYVESARHVRCENGALTSQPAWRDLRVNSSIGIDLPLQQSTSQTVDTTGLPVSLHPRCHVCDTVLFYCFNVLLFYCTLTSTLKYLPTHALDIDDHCSRAFQSCHAMHSTPENHCASSKKESVELLLWIILLNLSKK
jgi:hypothetical protein